MGLVAGWGGRVTIYPAGTSGDTTQMYLPVGRWEVSLNAPLADASHMEGGGWATFLPGIIECTGTFDAYYDTASGTDVYTRTNYAIIPGGAFPTAGQRRDPTTTGTTIGVCFYIDASDAGVAGLEYFAFPQFIVERVTHDQDVRGVSKYSVTGRAISAVAFNAPGTLPTLTNNVPTVPGQV